MSKFDEIKTQPSQKHVNSFIVITTHTNPFQIRPFPNPDMTNIYRMYRINDQYVTSCPTTMSKRHVIDLKTCTDENSEEFSSWLLQVKSI